MSDTFLQTTVSPHEARFQEAFLEYLKAKDEGRPVCIEALVGRYPDIEARLREAIRDEDCLLFLTTPGDAMGVEGPPQGRFGAYELMKEIARGGMGIVYRAKHLELDVEVAVKVLSGRLLHAPGERERFLREARDVASLGHGGDVAIVRIHDCGTCDGWPYFSMELAGRTLASQPGERRPPRDIARLMEQVARAIQFAHDRGVLHRDLKPANILLKGAAARVADFGLASRLDTGPASSQARGPGLVGQETAIYTPPADGTLAAAGEVAGTPPYMAPEQTHPGRRLTKAVDVYGLGAVLYEMLTGRAPFPALPGDTLGDVFRRVRAEEPEPPRGINPHADPDLEAVCLKCLQKEPARRYADAAEVADELSRNLRGEGVADRPPGLWEWLRQVWRTQPEPNPNYSWRAAFWLGPVLLGTGAAVFGLADGGGSGLAVWLVNGASAAVTAAVLWWYMLRRFGHLPATERHSLIIGAAQVVTTLLLTAAYVPLSASASAREALAMYPALAAASGVGLFTLGSTHWSRFFLIGLGVMGLAPVLAWWPGPSPLLYGGVVGAAMWYWAYAKKVLFGGS